MHFSGYSICFYLITIDFSSYFSISRGWIRFLSHSSLGSVRLLAMQNCDAALAAGDASCVAPILISLSRPVVVSALLV